MIPLFNLVVFLLIAVVGVSAIIFHRISIREINQERERVRRRTLRMLDGL